MKTGIKAEVVLNKIMRFLAHLAAIVFGAASVFLVLIGGSWTNACLYLALSLLFNIWLILDKGIKIKLTVDAPVDADVSVEREGVSNGK